MEYLVDFSNRWGRTPRQIREVHAKKMEMGESVFSLHDETLHTQASRVETVLLTFI